MKSKPSPLLRLASRSPKASTTGTRPAANQTSFFSITLGMAVAGLATFGAPSAWATSQTWDGGVGGTGTTLQTAANWSSDLAFPTSTETATFSNLNGTGGNLALTFDATFTGGTVTGVSFYVTALHTGSLTIDSTTANTGFRFKDLTIEAGAGAVTFGNGDANTFNLNFGSLGTTHALTNNSSNTVTFKSDMRFANGGASSSTAKTLTFDGSGNWQVDAVLKPTTSNAAGTFIVSKKGTGSLALNADNTGNNTNGNVTGLQSITIERGSILAGASGALGGGGGTVGAGGVTLGLANANSASLLNTGAFSQANNITVASGNTGTLTLGGNHATGTSIYTGNVILNGNVVLSAATGGQVNFTTGVISGGGKATVSGGGTISLTGANTYSGGTTVQSGTLLLGSATALGASTGVVTLSGGTLNLNGNNSTQGSIVFNGGSLTTTGGEILSLGSTGTAISFTGSPATASASGAINLTGASGGNIIKTATAGTPILSGALNLGGVSRTIALADTAADVVELTLSGQISNGAIVLDNGLSATSTVDWGTLALTGTNTYDGTTIITKGRIVINNATSLGSTVGGTTIGSRGTLALGGAGITIATGITVAENLTLNRNNTAGEYANTALQNNSGNNTLSGTISLSSNAMIEVAGGSLLISNSISQTAASSLTKTGVNQLILTGSNSYSGGTAVQGGTLILGTGGSLAATNTLTLGTGSTSGVFQLGDAVGTVDNTVTSLTVAGGTANAVVGGAAGVSTLTVNNSGAVSYSGILGGLGTNNNNLALTKTGAGTLTLTGANTHTGATQVSNGTLLVNGSLAAASSVNVDSGASLGGGVGGTAGTINGAVTSAGTITPGGTGTIGTLALGNNLTLSGGSISLDLSGTSNTTGGATNDLFTVAGNLTATGIVLISPTFVGGTPAVNTTYQFGSYTGTLTGAANFAAASRAITVNTTTANQLTLTYTGASFGNLTWNSTSSGAWDLVASQNWLNTDTIAQDYFYTGDAVTFDNTSGVQTAITLNNSLAPLSTAVNSTTNNFSFTGSGGIGGTGGLVKSGASTLTFNTANTYTGATSINEGTFVLGSTGSLGSTAITVASGATFNLDGSLAGTPLTVDAGATFTESVTGIVSGSAALATSGTTTLAGNNTRTGTTALNGGTLNVNSATAVGSGAITINGGTLDNTSGSAKTLTSNNAHNWNGDFAFGGSNDLNLGTGAVTLGGNRAVAVNGSTLTVGGAIGGAFSLTKTGAGTLLLSGANSFSGGTTVALGTLKIGNATALGGNAGAASVSSGAALDLNGTSMTGTNALTLNGAGISSGGALTNSSGSAGTYAGLVTLGSSSSIVANSGNIILSNTGSITGSGNNLTLGGTATGSSIASSIDTGAGTLTKTGTGLWILSGANTYTGTTTIENGTLRTIGASAVGSGSSAIALGTATSISSNFSATLQLNGVTTIARDVTVGASNSATTGIYTLDTNNGLSAVAVSGVLTLNQNLTVSGTTTGGFTLSGNIISGSSGSQTVTFTGATGGVFAASGAIGGGSGTIALVKNGGATLTISGTNSYTGGTTIGGGALDINNDAALGAAPGSPATNLTFSGSGSLRQASATSALTLHANRNIVINTGATATFNPNGATNVLTISGAVSNQTSTGNFTLATSGSLAASGTVVLAGSNNFAAGSTVSLGGGTNLGGGNLRLANSNALGSSAVTINGTGPGGPSWGEAALELSGGITIGSNVTFNISGHANGGSPAGDNLRNVSGNNTFNGAINITATGGSYQIDSAETGSLLTIGGSLTNTLGSSRTLNVIGAGNTLASGILAETGGAASHILVVKSGTGTLTLSGANTYTGATTVTAGKLSISSIANGGTASNIGQSTNTAANLVLGGGTLQYTGATASTDRAFTLSTGSTSTIEVSSAGVNLTFSGASAVTNGSLVKTGAGTLTLSGANGYTGSTTVSGGTLASGAAGGTLGGSVIVQSAAILAAGGAGTVGSATVGTPVTGSTTFNSGSIFSWDLNLANSADTASTTSFDTLATASVAGDGGIGAVFQIVLGGSEAFAENFWNISHSWTNIFTTNGTTPVSQNLASIFTSFSFANANGSPAVMAPTSGSFTFNGSTLEFNALPEPTSAMAGLLLAAGLLRRNRRNPSQAAV